MTIHVEAIGQASTQSGVVLPLIADGELVILRQNDRQMVTAVFSHGDKGWCLFLLIFDGCRSETARDVYPSIVAARQALAGGDVTWTS